MLICLKKMEFLQETLITRKMYEWFSSDDRHSKINKKIRTLPW